jgi:surfeit locus 1 family protein
VNGEAAARRPGIVLPGLFAATGIALLVGLGIWQLERKAWKENLIATLDRRLAAAPVALPPPRDWPHLTRKDSEFRRVAVHLDYLDRPHAFVWTGGSPLRADLKAPGYFVFVPARIASGEIIVVNAGYVPERRYPWTNGSADIVGYLRWPERPSWFVSEHDASASVWLVRDQHAMAQVKHWGDKVAPFYIDLESPVPPSGLPRPGPLVVKLRNAHLGYAITWFALAAALAAVFILWAGKRRRE